MRAASFFRWATSLSLVLLPLLATSSVRAQLSPALPIPRELLLAHGRLVTIDDGTVTGLRAVLDWGLTADTVLFDELGRFALLPPALIGDSVTITVEPADSARYYAVRASVSADRLTRPLDVLLVPRVWRIDGGRFAGAEIPITASATLRRGGDRGSFARVSSNQLVGWTTGSFPVPVVFRRDGTAAISANDSIAFWTTVRGVEASLGGRFFLPAGDTLLRGTIYPVDIRVDPRLDADAKTWVSWNREGQIFEGLISFRTAAEMRDESVVAHEILHLLGFGHTAAWQSTLAPRVAPGQGVTAMDVAYAQLLLRAHELERRFDVVSGFAASASFARSTRRD